ncbi:MAG: PBP1A family penicillin-binding protein [Thermodesulfobacteriota bacterium]|nr:PBP1A family penicillin-binding protein [Thermodesulfobacteriota bacterium]
MTKKKSRAEVLKKREKRARKNIFVVILKWLCIFLVAMGVITAAGLGALYFYMSRDLPRITRLSEYKPSVVTSVYSDDQRKIGEFYKERRIVIPLSDMPENLKNAFVAAEDSRFLEHPGIDFISIFRAFMKNIKAGTIVQGGSTITQQVTKSFLLTPEKTYRRKIREAILAYRIDKAFTKDEILYLYLNQIYLGHGAYGVEAAAQNCFGKHAKEMNLAECSMLAGLPQAPSRYSPFIHPERARQRQVYVLNRMKEDGYITNLQATNAMNTKLDIKPRKNWFIESVPCYTEHVRRYVEDKYGRDALYRQGLKVYTAVDIEFQKIARQAVVKGLEDLDKRQGFRGPLTRISSLEYENFCRRVQQEISQDYLEPDTVYKGLVMEVDDKEEFARVSVGSTSGIIKGSDLSWARPPDKEVACWQVRAQTPSEVLSSGDVILVRALEKDQADGEWLFSLYQEPVVQSALLSIEAETGQVKAMIGGRNYRDSQFNRAVQSRRQPGSAFKPFIYAAALDKGYTPATMILDSPVVFKDTERDYTWKPHNYKEKFYGPTLFRHALVKSRNVVTVKILRDIGIDYMINYARELGISSQINRDLSIALGSSGTSLLEMVNAYSVFSNLGYRVAPVFITKIVDRDGNILEKSELRRKKVIDMSTAYIMTNLLESVVKSGTGWRIRALKRPAAGKTGTTNNLFDAWFMGYTPRYITGVWVGFDSESPLGKGETGSRAASPIWLDYMKKILEGRPVRTFNVPEGVVFAKVDAKTGLLPSSASEKVVLECFKEGTVPVRHTPEKDRALDAEALFKSGI